MVGKKGDVIMSQYDNTNKGTLGKNLKQREGKKDAEYNGTLNVDGVEYYIDAWVKDGRNGKFFSLRVKPKESRGNSPPPKKRQDDDEVPF